MPLRIPCFPWRFHQAGDIHESIAKYPNMMDSGPRFDWRRKKIATTARRAGVAIWLLRQSKRGPESIIAGYFALIPPLQRLNICFIGQIMLKCMFNFDFRQ